MTIAETIEAGLEALEARGTAARIRCEEVLEGALAVGREELTVAELAEYEKHSAEFAACEAELAKLIPNMQALAREGKRLERAVEKLVSHGA